MYWFKKVFAEFTYIISCELFFAEGSRRHHLRFSKHVFEIIYPSAVLLVKVGMGIVYVVAQINASPLSTMITGHILNRMTDKFVLHRIRKCLS